MKLVYIAHPYSGKRLNVLRVQRIIKRLLHKYPGYSFYSPLHALGFFYKLMDYDTGMEHCYEALRRCDELWLCNGWTKSRGCCREYSYAITHRIPVKFMDNDGDFK